MTKVIPKVLVTGCCKYEIQNVQSATYSWSRFGVYELDKDYHNSNCLIIGGWINESRVDEIKNAYSQLRQPKAVIAIGVCTISGSPFELGAEKFVKITDILPVDIFIPGCPPKPEIILDAMINISKVTRVRKDKEIDRKKLFNEVIKRSTT